MWDENYVNSHSHLMDADTLREHKQLNIFAQIISE